MPSSPTIALTGATGRLGRLILRELLVAGHNDLRCLYRSAPGPVQEGVHWIKGDLTDVFSLDPLLDGADAVIHAAGLVSHRVVDKARLFAINEGGTRHVVDTCLHMGVRHLIYVGSAAALGFRPLMSYYDESATWVKSPLSTPYAESKYRGELEVWRGREEGLGVSVLLPATTLYPGGGMTGSLGEGLADGGRSYLPGGHSFVDGRDVARFAAQYAAADPTDERVILAGFDLPLREWMIGAASRRGYPPPDQAASYMSALLRTLSLRLRRRPAPTLTELRIAFRDLYVSARLSREKYGMTYREMEETMDSYVVAARTKPR